MEELEYKKSFEKLKEFQEKQNRQKMRGLNDYNTFNVVRKASLEVGMHSNVIYSLINPNGLHYQNDLFLNLFIEKVLGFSIEDFGKVFSVNVEEQTDNNKRIDFTIKSKNYFIGIEMKVNAIDLDNQISDYYEDLETKADKETVLMYYLTKNGKDAPQSSKNYVDIKRVSFEKHILDWLEVCQDEVRNITNLYIALEDYKNIVKKITNKYKGNVMNLADYIQEDESIYKLALEIQKTLPTVRKNIIDNFFKEVINLLQNKLGTDWIIQLNKDKKMGLSTRHDIPFKIYKKSWVGNNKLIFGFEFQKNNYYGGYFGVARTNNCVTIKNDITDNFKNELDILKYNLKTTSHWLHWAYLPDNDDFIKYILYNENIEEKFVNEIYKLIEIFEINSNLMTEINDYLHKKVED